MKATKYIRYYTDYNQDFVETANQHYVLPDDYEWIRKGIKAKILSFLTYGTAVVFGGFYCKAVLHVNIKNRKALKSADKGCFIYGNHTQPFGDVIIPALASFPKRIYTLCSPSNLGLSGIGKALPYLGALPLPENISGLRKLTEAVKKRSSDGNCIVIYPEAHVWEYYTEIRPFSDSSFLYAVKNRKPVFSMTATYQKHKSFKRPEMTVFIDGPFFPDENLSQREKAKQLCEEVYETMKKRSLESNCEYIVYKKTDCK